jgi:glycosyltransferase involved in cell wall biosynthesis
LPAIAVADNIRFECIRDTVGTTWLSRTRNDIFALPRRLKREKISAVVSLLNFGPIWSPVPHILFQRNSLYYCPYYLPSISGRLKWETTLRRKLAVASMMRADLIVTPSNAMADMIRETCPKTRSRRFYTLYHGFMKASLQEPLDSQFAQLMDRKTGAKLLYPTHPARHKGFEVLFEMLAKLKADGLKFRLFTTISSNDWPEGISLYERRIIQLSLQDNVVFMGRVPQGQMGTLYTRCDLMVYPSLCESFGFSMIEAMGHGLPIVAAGTGVNCEICGGGALYYAPFDASAGAETIKEALRPEVAQRLREGGRARLNSFDWSWRRYAREFVEMIRMIGMCV